MTRERLEAERDFLLRSLDDLEAERAAGDIDDASYRALHDDYTARAAAAIRALGDGAGSPPPDSPPPDSPVPRNRRVLVITGIALFVVATGLTLAAALGARLPGSTSSGNSGSTRSTEGIDRTEQIRRLERTVARNPDDVATRLLLAGYLEADGRAADALRTYDDVIAIDAANAQAHAEAGRILYLTAQSAPADQAADLVDAARARLDRAVELDADHPDADYPDARFYRAIVLANEFGEFQAAQGDLQRYLVAAPNGRWSAQARQLLADVTKALETPTTAP